MNHIGLLRIGVHIMKISTKGRYGLRAMVDLAVNSQGSHVSLNSIAERQEVSENYLEQVFSTLRKAGLVRSIKGAQGGYILAADPSEITVGRVLRALEGSLSVVDETEGQDGTEQGIQACIRKHVWDRINKCINETVDSITLEDLADEYRKLTGQTPVMYYI